MSKTTTTTTTPATTKSPGRDSLPGSAGSRLAARLWTVGLGLVLTAAGLATCWYLWLSFQKAKTTDSWARVPCEVIAAGIDDSGRSQHGMVKYEAQVSYRYEFAGKTRVSNNIRHLSVTSLSKDEIEKKAKAYPVGLQTICLVNPENPDEAVLKAETKAPLYTMWFPGIFVVGGLGIVIAGVRGRRSQPKRLASPTGIEPVSKV